MKNIITLLLILIACSSIQAQPGCKTSHRPQEPPKIEEMVSDLSAIQKKKLNTLMQSSRKEIDRLQSELENVRKQIRGLMDKDGNNADRIFPLFDREANLRAEISKEMYRTRQQIANILTKEQLAEFRKCLKANREKDKKCGQAMTKQPKCPPSAPGMEKPQRVKQKTDSN